MCLLLNLNFSINLTRLSSRVHFSAAIVTPLSAILTIGSMHPGG